MSARGYNIYTAGSGFLYLPQCLHQIAECYHLKDEDEKAIQFLKAEKIYYETALIDTQRMQEKIGNFSVILQIQQQLTQLMQEWLWLLEFTI